MIPFNCTIKKEARQKASLFRMFVYSGALNNVFRTAPIWIHMGFCLISKAACSAARHGF